MCVYHKALYKSTFTFTFTLPIIFNIIIIKLAAHQLWSSDGMCAVCLHNRLPLPAGRWGSLVNIQTNTHIDRQHLTGYTISSVNGGILQNAHTHTSTHRNRDRRIQSHTRVQLYTHRPTSW